MVQLVGGADGAQRGEQDLIHPCLLFAIGEVGGGVDWQVRKGDVSVQTRSDAQDPGSEIDVFHLVDLLTVELEMLALRDTTGVERDEGEREAATKGRETVCLGDKTVDVPPTADLDAGLTMMLSQKFTFALSEAEGGGFFAGTQQTAPGKVWGMIMKV